MTDWEHVELIMIGMDEFLTIPEDAFSQTAIPKEVDIKERDKWLK